MDSKEFVVHFINSILNSIAFQQHFHYIRALFQILFGIHRTLQCKSQPGIFNREWEENLI